MIRINPQLEALLKQLPRRDPELMLTSVLDHPSFGALRMKKEAVRSAIREYVRLHPLPESQPRTDLGPVSVPTPKRKPQGRWDEVVEAVSWDKLAGYHELKAEVQKHIIKPLQR